MWVCAPSGGERSVGGGSAVSVRAPGVQALPGAVELGQLGLQAALCVCQALWLSPGAARHPQECGSSRLPELPRLHMEVAARKREGRGRERGKKKKKNQQAPSQQSTEPKLGVRQRTVHPIPLPGSQERRPRQARVPQAAARTPGVRPGGERRRGVPAPVYDRGHRSITPAVPPGYAPGLGPWRQKAPARGIS